MSSPIMKPRVIVERNTRFIVAIEYVGKKERVTKFLKYCL